MNKLPLTKPVWPFSPRNPIPYRTRVAQHFHTKPAQQLHDFPTIDWFRKRCGNYAVKRSLLTLLPNNGIPPNTNPTDKERHQHTLSKSNNSKQNDSCKYLIINPKYLYNDITFNKITMLRDIFLAFDEDCSRKMEMDELLQLFKQNELNVQLEDLIELFFNKSTPKKGDNTVNDKNKELYLDFKEFVMFALERDSEFRKFMRRLKMKYLHCNGNSNSNSTERRDVSIGEFLPMSFDLLLDYFIKKGKERESRGKVTAALQAMDNVVKYIKHKELKTKGVLPEIPFDDTQFERINFEQLFKEFALLMKVDKKEKGNEEDNVEEQIKHKQEKKSTIKDDNVEYKMKEGKIKQEEVQELLFKLDLREERVDKDGDPVFLSVMKKLQEKRKMKRNESNYWNNMGTVMKGSGSSSTKCYSGCYGKVVLPAINANKGRLVRNKSCGRYEENSFNVNQSCNRSGYMSKSRNALLNNNINNISVSINNNNNNANELYSNIVKQYLDN